MRARRSLDRQSFLGGAWLALLVGACATPDPSSGPPPALDRDAATSNPQPSEPLPRAGEVLKAVLPAFGPSEHDLHVLLLRPATVWASPGEAPLVLDRRSTPLSVERAFPPLLPPGADDWDSDPDTLLPVLCDDEGHRLVVWVPTDDLGRAARHGFWLSPGTPATGPASVGLRLRAGQRLQGSWATWGKQVRMDLQGGWYRARGLVEPATLGYTFRPEGELPHDELNVRTREPIRLSAEPGGPAFAEVMKASVSGHRHEERDGQVRITLVDPAGDALLTGWAPASAVEPTEDGGAGWGTASGRGTGQLPFVLPAGTWLGHPDSHPDDERPVGYLKRDLGVRCLRDCAGERPVVVVPTCVGRLELRSDRAGASSQP